MRGRAFTLIELLVVVAIIALLMGILLPAVSAARERGRAARCLANLHEIGIAMVAYGNDNNAAFAIPSHSLSQVSWLVSLLPYGATVGCRTCPDDRRPPPVSTSYALNDFLEGPLLPGVDFDPVTGAALPGGRRAVYDRFTTMPHPDNAVLVVESYSGDHVHVVGVTTADALAGEIDVTRHGQSANYLFVDGHAAPINWSMIQEFFQEGVYFINPEAVH